MIDTKTTAVLAVSPYAQNTYKQADEFIRFARRQRIPLRWLTFQEPYRSKMHNKVHPFQKQADTLQKQGFEYAYIVDITDPQHELYYEGFSRLSKAHIPGKVAFFTERHPSVIYRDTYFLNTLKGEGVVFSPLSIYGRIEDIYNLFDICITLQQEFLAEAVSPGIAEYCLLDRKEFYPKMEKYINDDHFMLSLASIYHPDLFRIAN